MSRERNSPKPISRHAGADSTPNPDRRKSARLGREKGIRVFIPAVQLEAAGIDPNAEPPEYVVQGVSDRPTRGLVLVRLYPSEL